MKKILGIFFYWMIFVIPLAVLIILGLKLFVARLIIDEVMFIAGAIAIWVGAVCYIYQIRDSIVLKGFWIVMPSTVLALLSVYSGFCLIARSMIIYYSLSGSGNYSEFLMVAGLCPLAMALIVYYAIARVSDKMLIIRDGKIVTDKSYFFNPPVSIGRYKHCWGIAEKTILLDHYSRIKMISLDNKMVRVRASAELCLDTMAIKASQSGDTLIQETSDLNVLETAVMGAKACIVNNIARNSAGDFVADVAGKDHEIEWEISGLPSKISWRINSIRVGSA